MDDETSAMELTLDPGETGVVGTMTVENSGDAPISLAVRGDGPVLRGKMMIREEDATTPALRIFFAVQSMYLHPETATTAMQAFLPMAQELISQVPSTGMIMADVGEALIAGEYRDALAHCFELLSYEAELEKRVAAVVEAGAAAQEGGDR